MAKRYLELSDGTAGTFWEGWREGAQVFTRFGKLGATGQLTVKRLASDAAAKQLLDKLLRDKLGKGYAERGKPKPAAPEVIVIPPGAERLELVEGNAAKFWQIQRTAKTLTITSGKVGTPGTQQQQQYKDEWTARTKLRDQVTARQLKGYQHVLAGPRLPAPAPGRVNPQLEATIVKGDQAGYMVYADWLMEQGDPRGPIAAFPDDKRGQAKANALIWKHRAFCYGPLAVYAVEKPDRHAAVAARWKRGWIDSLRLSAVTTWRVGQLPVGDCAELVRLLPKVTSARLVRELVIGCPRVEAEFEFGNTLEALAQVAEALPNLRRLVLGDFTSEDSELSWSHFPAPKQLWKHFPRLEYLKIHAGNIGLGKLELPELRELWIESGGLDRTNLDDILKSNLPKLETLNLWMGQDNYGCDIRPKDLAKLVEALPRAFPKLQHLGLANSQWGNELAPLLGPSEILRQVLTLDLSRSHLTDEGVRVYAEHRAVFNRLIGLDVSRCLLGKEGIKLVKTLCKNANVDRQVSPADYQPEPDEAEAMWWRYSAVGE